MSNSPATEGDQDEQKSKKPAGRTATTVCHRAIRTCFCCEPLSRHSIQATTFACMATNYHCRYGITCFSSYRFDFHPHWHCLSGHLGTGMRHALVNRATPIVFVQVFEFDIDYTDSNCISSTGNLTCADVLQRSNFSGASCRCTKTITLDKDYTVSSHC